MYVRVEPTGCCERKGMVQVRFCFYLDEGDAGYAKCRVKDGEVTVSNPFHNHFIYVEPTATNKEILDIGEVFLKEAYGYWEDGKFPALVNKPHAAPRITAARGTACREKAALLGLTTLERKV